MITSWNIIHFQAKSGDFPVKDFIDKLSPKAKGKVINAIDLLEEYGLGVGPPRVKKLTGTELWELRIVGKNNIRIFYITVSQRNFLLLHGFIKKKQKTDKREVNTALNRLSEYYAKRNKNVYCIYSNIVIL